LEKLEQFQVTELPSQVAMYQWVPKEVMQPLFAIFGKWFAQGVFQSPPDKRLNDKFPEIKPMKMKEMIETAWGPTGQA
jgi:hypothetical protein